MNFENIKLTREDKIATVTIDRPKAMNALNRQTLLELQSCFGEIEQMTDVAVVIITGGGEKAFVAGADIGAMQSMNAVEARSFSELGHRALNAIEGFALPVIAAINGYALGGGCELALACDMRFASENAQFGQPEVNLGVIPGFGGTQRLPRLVGKGLANELVMSGRMIDAEEAYRIGLVNRVVKQKDLVSECTELAQMIALRGPAAVRLCKKAVTNGMEMDLQRACDYEAGLFAFCFSTEEQREGMTAFLEKRKPKF